MEHGVRLGAPGGSLTTVAELRRLLAEGTPGPWQVSTPETKAWGAEIATVETDILVTRPDDDSLIEPGDSETDAALIVAAVNALPALLDVVEAAQITHDAFFSHAVSDRVAQQRARELGAALAALDRS